MLILTRRVGEKLVIGENVTITVLGVKGNQIRIGIDAPPEVQVHREEIFKFHTVGLGAGSVKHREAGAGKNGKNANMVDIKLSAEPANLDEASSSCGC